VAIPHTWLGAHVRDDLASRLGRFTNKTFSGAAQASAQMGHNHVCWFPIVQLGSPPCMLFKMLGTRFRVSGIRFQVLRSIPCVALPNSVRKMNSAGLSL